MAASKTDVSVDGSPQIFRHQLVIARKPKCQLVLTFGVFWKAKKAKQ